MAVTLRDLIVVLESYFPPELSVSRVMYVLAILTSIYPILRLHHHQARGPRQPRYTAWFKGLRPVALHAFHPERLAPGAWEGDGPGDHIANDLYRDLDNICEFLGINGTGNEKDRVCKPPTVLCTTHLDCIICPPDPPMSLRRRTGLQKVRLLHTDFTSSTAFLYVAHCPRCSSDYYPDCVTFKGDNNERLQRLEYNAQYLRISKRGIWVERGVAVAQEKALLRFRAGWSNFAEWINSIADSNEMTPRRSQRLFLEHFSRRLIVAQNREAEFLCPAHPNATNFAKTIRNLVGKDGGTFTKWLKHGCQDCTHEKRFHADLETEGAIMDNNEGVADMDNLMDDQTSLELPQNETRLREMPAGMPDVAQCHQQVPPPEGEARGYVRMAVMDGKTIGHRICAVIDCRNGLVNYRNGRFCEEHLQLRNICAIIPCGRPVEIGEVTCDDDSHRTWHRKWLQRFSRLSYPGVRRVIRRQEEVPPAPETEIGVSRPVLTVNLPQLGNTPGSEVVHTFRARKLYCIETVQWACGVPIGWGKCYKSESLPQVLSIIDRIWAMYREFKPAFMVYDDACDLLRHIVTQDRGSHWLVTTKFIVDAWHYIGHKAVDVLCRTWCNPAPLDGSQPDLVWVEEDELGEKHTTRAFNTETAEQLNSWLTGFEAQLRQMSDVNFDIYVHVLLMLFGEMVEEKILEKGRGLDEDL
ncbi:hypothetical protein BD410DRAFT_900077 [Rickenella mellea]|uniref:CxC5 like cysteine cluster associated with KDZ domain-containing protein n=1 Tax=Rickenella mellea TaxID=50990 RepID=A0A4Y7PWH2_9AGAM|nr:hypothetical protein BD410DRAFT_823070 [Rickenella mellea]TDL19753.1 hypothetical protein BD410DRAFT_900077 [Rickenella mellea]